jgi:hypothetical protein
MGASKPTDISAGFHLVCFASVSPTKIETEASKLRAASQYETIQNHQPAMVHGFIR